MPAVQTLPASQSFRSGHCTSCDEALESRYASCTSCRSSYHPACGLEANGCVKEGCKARAQGYHFQHVDRAPRARSSDFGDAFAWWELKLRALCIVLTIAFAGLGLPFSWGMALGIGVLLIVGLALYPWEADRARKASPLTRPESA